MNERLTNLDKLHTTELGFERIRKNLSLDSVDILNWCRNQIGLPDAVITRKGKNWYVSINGCIFAVNAFSSLALLLYLNLYIVLQI